MAAAALDFCRRRRRWIPLLAAVGFSAYGAYKVYHLPSVSRNRRKLSRLVGTLISVTEAAASSAETVSLVSSDLNRFLRSDSDELPTSLKQFSKITRSDAFSASLSRVSEALTVGILRGFRPGEESDSTEAELRPTSTFSDRILDKLFSSAGSGFASVVVGSFARNLVIAFYSTEYAGSSLLESDPWWVDLICGDKLRQLIGDCIQLFVSTAVTAYLDKTMNVNTYDEFFAGLTNPNHGSKARDILVSVCNGAMETLVKTSHHVLNNSNHEAVELSVENEILSSNAEEGGGWIDRVSSTLAVPSNRRFVLDMTGRVTFETVRSFLEFVLWNSYDGARRSIDAVREAAATEKGVEVMRYVSMKSMVIVTICIALCMHIFAGTRVFMPA